MMKADPSQLDDTARLNAIIDLEIPNSASSGQALFSSASRDDQAEYSQPIKPTGLPKLMPILSSVIEKGEVKTPEDMAKFLEPINLQPISQAVWGIMESMQGRVAERVDWAKLYAPATDKKSPKPAAPLKQETPAAIKGEAPAEDAVSKAFQALSKMRPIFRDVYVAAQAGKTPDQIAEELGISRAAVFNITNQVQARIAVAVKAEKGTLEPKMKDGQFDGGRPDLAQGGQAQYDGKNPGGKERAARSLTRRRKIKTALAVIVFAGLVALGVAVVGNMKPEPKISGHRVSYWIEKLEDRDPATRENAGGKLLEYISADELRPYHDKLEKMAKAGNDEAACLLRFIDDTLNK